MTEPTKEQVWKEEARKAYQDQQSQDNEGGCREPIGFVQGYLAAKKSDFEELQKTREQLVEHRIALKNLLFYETDNSHTEAENLLEKYNQYFQDKDKQGE